MLENVYEGLNARSKVHLSEVYPDYFVTRRSMQESCIL